MNGLWLAFLLLSLLVAFTALVPMWPYALVAWQFRSPEKMMPSARRLRVFRAHTSILAVFFFAVFLYAVLPGTEVERGNIALLVMVIGFAGIGVVMLAVVFSRSHEARRAREAGTEPPTEPSEEGYGVLYLSVAFTAVGLLVCSVLFHSVNTRQAAAEAPLSPEEQAQVDEQVAEVEEVLDDYFDNLVPTRHVIHPAPPLVASREAIAEGEVVVEPVLAVAIDPATRTPSRLWDEGEGYDESVTPDELLAGADLAVALPGLLCTVTGVIVTETADAVTVDLVVVLAEGASDCGRPDIPRRTWYPIDLAAPLEGRDVLTGDGSVVEG